MNLNIKKYSTASSLPLSWDNPAEEYFQTRDFLIHAEKYNPCKQRYYLLVDSTGNDILSCAVVYTIPIDLLSFLKIKSPVKMNIIGIPCSVSASGILGNPKYQSELLSKITQIEKGLTIGLNLPPYQNYSHRLSFGQTLPTVIFSNRFSSFNNYLDQLRSPYKRRYYKITKPFKEIKKIIQTCSCFTPLHYQYYLDVLKRSKGKLETLTFDFFKNLPDIFRLHSYYNEKTLLGWHINIHYKNRLGFFLGGINYACNPEFNTYFNILFKIIEEGIDSKASSIDLGQTAEIPKTRTGGKLCIKYLCGFHSNSLLNIILSKTKHLLEYNYHIPETRVLKEDNYENTDDQA